MKVIFDTYYTYDRTIFEYNNCSQVIGASWMAIIHQMLLEENITVELADDYIKQGVFSTEDVFISESKTRNTDFLLQTSAKPLIIYSGESPNVDWKFYTFLKKYTRRYNYAIVFSGARDYVHPSTTYLPLYWPTNESVQFGKIIPKDKRLVMIASNKKQHSSLNQSFGKDLLKRITFKFLIKTVPSLKLKDLYSFRMKTIKYFSNISWFHLYGKDWEKVQFLTYDEKIAIDKLNPKQIKDKHQLLCAYTFAICFENCVYPGYITEKIFDCFLAGCIPIYYGAPDISDFIPRNTFINLEEFESLNDLENYISTMADEKIEEYRNNINMFLHSNEYIKYTGMYFAQTLYKCIKSDISK
jgi:alpha(1,3/1,4) fucosyltransferase